MSKLRILELFGGIGACSKALERLGVDYEIADYVEIDKYAVKSFNAIHNTNFEPQDIKTWDKDIEVDLIMHGSPCQDFSLAGKQAGGDKDSGTRSSLMYETIRIVDKLKPKYVIWENVKNLLSKNHKHNFDAYLETMKQLGYVNYYQVLNAKDYGIPQNRERVFTISILGNENYEFPKGEECENKINRKYGLYGQVTRWGVYDENGLAPTITASMGMGGGHVPMIEDFQFPQKQELKLKLKDMLEDKVDEKYYLSDIAIDKIARHKNKIIENENPSESSTLHAGYYKMGGRDQQYIKDNRIRKLTPKECWRLMGFDDVDYEKAAQVNSNTQLYKQAGNSIVVNVLEAILNSLLNQK